MQFDYNSDSNILNQATAAGYSTVELYIQNLLERDAERLQIQQGIEALRQGRHRPFEEFDREFREKHKLASK